MSRLSKIAEQSGALEEDSSSGEDVVQNIMDFFGEEDDTFFSSSDWNFVKLEANRTVLRLLKSPDGSPFQKLVVHKYYVDGQLTFNMDLDFAVEDQEVRKHLIESGNLTPSDIRVIQESGDPFTRLARQLQANGNKEAARDLFPKSTYFWNVIKRPDDEVGILETSSRFYNQVRNIIKESGVNFYGDDFDLAVIGNGKEGLERRYESFLPVRRSASDPKDLSPYNLLDVGCALKFVKPQEKASHLFQIHGSVAEACGMREEEWIVEDVGDDDIPFGG